jgi:hypothetical protein
MSHVSDVSHMPDMSHVPGMPHTSHMSDMSHMPGASRQAPRRHGPPLSGLPRQKVNGYSIVPSVNSFPPGLYSRQFHPIPTSLRSLPDEMTLPLKIQDKIGQIKKN